MGIGARSVGGTIAVSQSELIINELLGESNGDPGQTVQFQSVPILERREDEYLIVTPPGELPLGYSVATP